MSFNLMSMVPGVGEKYELVATNAIVVTGIVSAGLVARAKMKKLGAAAVTPDDHLSVRGIFEIIIEFIQGLVDMVIGEHGRKYTPMFAAIFLFVAANNVVGMIPGMTPATEHLNTTLAMGTFMFLVYNYLGAKEHGIHYLKHFLGPMLWLAPLMLVVELISHIVRPISLGLRLANVITGDHTVVEIFTGLIPLIAPIPFMLLGLFICLVQAFVFTLLSMVYVALATSHEH